MRTIKIFLASSSELKSDREQFEILISRLGPGYKKNGFFLELVVWENFLDAMTADGLQKSYNKAVGNSDIFVMLFFTKVGPYTQEEFETAFGIFTETGRPFIFTYFKNAPVNTGDLVEAEILSLFSFKKKLNALHHYVTNYASVEDLKFQFSVQLNKLIEEGHISQSQLDFTASLKATLEGEKVFCRRNNIYIYGANILRALLKDKNGLLFTTLEESKKGYASLLAIKLAGLIDQIFIANKKANPYSEEDWFERADVKNAVVFAEKDKSRAINEKHLLLGIFDLKGSTVQMIQHDMGESAWNAFLNYLNSDLMFRTPVTPLQ